METEASAPKPSWYHKALFWFLLATLSMAIPEVGTMNDPIPWSHAGGWLIGYPVYGLHILFLAGIMYRWPLGGFLTLMAYGGLFGLYEGYMIKQLWNPSWAPEVTQNIGGVRILHTHFLVFWVHPLFAFVVPLVLSEMLALRPGRLTVRLRLDRRWAPVVVLVLGVYFGIMMGGKMPTRAMLVIPMVAVAVVLALGLPWRLLFGGSRFRMEDLLPGKVGLGVFGVLLAGAYGLLGTKIRPEAFPGYWLPHVLVWGIYAFLIAVIVLNTRAERARPLEDVAAISHGKAARLTALAVLVFMGTAFLQATHAFPGEWLTLITFVVGGAAIEVALLVCLIMGLYRVTKALRAA